MRRSFNTATPPRWRQATAIELRGRLAYARHNATRRTNALRKPVRATNNVAIFHRCAGRPFCFVFFFLPAAASWTRGGFGYGRRTRCFRFGRASEKPVANQPRMQNGRRARGRRTHTHHEKKPHKCNHLASPDANPMEIHAGRKAHAGRCDNSHTHTCRMCAWWTRDKLMTECTR